VVNVATRRAQDERLREEIEEHIALQTAENLRAALSPVEARRQAMLKFGGVEAMKQDYRAERGLLFIENLLGDLRNAGRTIRRMPGLAAVIVVSLAIGIGVNTTIFSWIQMILFQPLPGVSGASNFLLVEPRTETGGVSRRFLAGISRLADANAGTAGRRGISDGAVQRGRDGSD
jgi:hypothetical protein